MLSRLTGIAVFVMNNSKVVCLGLAAFGFLFTVAAPTYAGTTKSTSTISSSFVSTNFDFDHADLSTPASYFNGGGTNTVYGAFTFQSSSESAADGKPCTLPGGVTNAGTEYALVGDIGVSRNNKSGDLLFSSGTTGTTCFDFSTFPTPPFRFVFTETGVFTGGTGASSNASGTFTQTGRGAILSLDATGARSVGWSKSKAKITLTVP